MIPSPGLVLGERYRLLEPIGRGGQSEIWRATDERLGRDVAVKLLAGEQAREPMHRGRIEREALALASIAHPGVISIHDYGEQPDPHGAPVPYIVMELVDGPDLAGHLARQGRLGDRETIDLVVAILDAVARAHEIGIIHGDLKPANVLLSPTGPKVGDFGVARILGRETGATVPLATPAYAAPEVIAGGRPTAASDVYSAAAIAFEALAGRRPAAGEDVAAALAGAPGPLRDAIARGLDPDPARRAASAADLASALRRGGTPQPVSAASTQTIVRPVTEALPHPRRRPPTIRVPRMPRLRLRLPNVPLAQAVGRLRSVRPGVVIAALALIALAIARGRADATLAIPALVGQTVDRAEILADDAGFEVTTSIVEHGGRAGIVVAQNPTPGRLRPAGSRIALSVAEGVPQVEVPDVTGMPIDLAIRALEAAKLRAGTDVAYVPSTQQPAGTVVRTIPGARETVDEQSTVQIIAVQIPVREPAQDEDRGKGKGKPDKDDD